MTGSGKSTTHISDDDWTKRIRARVAAGGVHRDEDGWWVDDVSGELIGPDPDMERELDDEETARADLYHGTKLVRRGRPPSHDPKRLVTIRLDADLLERLKADGAGWQTRVNALLRKAVGI